MSFLWLRREKRRFGFGSNLAVNGQAAAQLELFHGCGGLCSKQAVRIPGVKAEVGEPGLQGSVVDGCRVAVPPGGEGRTAEQGTVPGGGSGRPAGDVRNARVLRHIPVKAVVVGFPDFPVQVAAGAVAGAALHTDKVARSHGLACMDGNAGKVAEVHIEAGLADAHDHPAAPALLCVLGVLPACPDNGSVYRGIEALVGNAYQVEALMQGAVAAQVVPGLGNSEGSFVRCDHGSGLINFGQRFLGGVVQVGKHCLNEHLGLFVHLVAPAGQKLNDPFFLLRFGDCAGLAQLLGGFGCHLDNPEEGLVFQPGQDNGGKQGKAAQACGFYQQGNDLVHVLHFLSPINHCDVLPGLSAC